MKAVVAALLLLTYGDGPRPSFQIVRHYDLAFLTHKQALELNGQRIVCRVDLDSRPDERGGFTPYDCASHDLTARASGPLPAPVAARLWPESNCGKELPSFRAGR
jgi:hypothetical protein